MYKVLTGAQLYSVRTLLQTAESMDAALGQLREIGYTSVQMSGQSTDIPAETVRDLLDKHHLICPSTHGSFKDFEENLPEVVRVHKLWNSPYPGVGSMPAEFAETEEGFREFARRANLVARKLKDEGLTFIYHNHAFEFQKFGNKAGLQILLDEMPDVQFELDVYWLQSGGVNPVDWIRKVQGRMDIVHFKEMVGCRKRPDHPYMTDMAPIGKGNMDWQKIMQACDETGVKYAFIEQDNAVQSDPIDCMRTSFLNLSALGGRFSA